MIKNVPFAFSILQLIFITGVLPNMTHPLRRQPQTPCIKITNKMNISSSLPKPCYSIILNTKILTFKHLKISQMIFLCSITLYPE